MVGALLSGNYFILGTPGTQGNTVMKVVVYSDDQKCSLPTHSGQEVPAARGLTETGQGQGQGWVPEEPSVRDIS